jgi:hypothetical protein
VTEARIRGRRGRERRIAEAHPRASAGPALRGHGEGRLRVADLSGLPGLLAGTAEAQALAERYRLARGGRAGGDLRHVVYASMPHGAKTFLAAALVQATGERLVWVARDAEIGDRVAEELVAWLGDPASVVTLEPRSALPFERSELVRDETAARVAALSAWRGATAAGNAPASAAAPRILVASVQALLQRTLEPGALPASPL